VPSATRVWPFALPPPASLCSTHQLLKVDPRRSTYLACGLFVRGDIMISDVQRNIERMRRDIHMVYWNEEGFKVGLCTVPPVSQVGRRVHSQCLSYRVSRRVHCHWLRDITCSLAKPDPPTPTLSSSSMRRTPPVLSYRVSLRVTVASCGSLCVHWSSPIPPTPPPPFGTHPAQPQSLLCLANNCAVRYPLRSVWATAVTVFCCVGDEVWSRECALLRQCLFFFPVTPGSFTRGL
jgi:hypothetical protein